MVKKISNLFIFLGSHWYIYFCALRFLCLYSEHCFKWLFMKVKQFVAFNKLYQKVRVGDFRKEIWGTRFYFPQYYGNSAQIRRFPGPYFPVSGVNTEIYSVNSRIHSGYGKMRTRNMRIWTFWNQGKTQQSLSKTMLSNLRKLTVFKVYFPQYAFQT